MAGCIGRIRGNISGQVQDSANVRNLASIAIRASTRASVKDTDEHLYANFALAHRLIEAKHLKEALDIQREFARQTVETYVRRHACSSPQKSTQM